MATASMTLCRLLTFPSTCKLKSRHPHQDSIRNSSPPSIFSFSLSSSSDISSGKGIQSHYPSQRKGIKPWRLAAAPGEAALPSGSIPVENSQEIVSASGDDGVALIIQVLLFTAFVALSVLTLGVIYIAVQDFLQKRETEKFEKEEAFEEKSGKKKKVKARAGPRGFGQKIDEDDD